MIEIIGGIMLLAGASIVLIGAVGLLRFPDFYCRLHSAGVIDTLGAGMLLLGMLLLAGTLVVVAKILMIGMLIFFLSPVITHALAKSAFESASELSKSGQSAHGMEQGTRNKTKTALESPWGASIKQDFVVSTGTDTAIAEKDS